MEQIRSPLVARKVGYAGKAVVVHADAGWLKKIRCGEIDFFEKLSKQLTQQGMAMRLAAVGGGSSRVLMEQDHLNILIGHQASYGANILHAAPAYIWGFWYLDEVGVNWNSSIRFARFCPDQINTEKAHYFFNGVSGHMLRENVSRIAQEPRTEEPVETARAVIFCQDVEQGADRCHHLTTEEMIRTTAQTCRGDLVYLKLHPDQTRLSQKAIIAICNDYTNIKISDASIHDLSAASDVVVSQNSAAGFEALMQKKPVITCARSDFWHATLTPKTTHDLRDAITYGREAMAGFEYEKFLYWFLQSKCLEPQKPEFGSRAFSRIRDKGFL